MASCIEPTGHPNLLDGCFSPELETSEPLGADVTSVIPYVAYPTGNLDIPFDGDQDLHQLPDGEIERVIIAVHGYNSSYGGDAFGEFYNVTYALSHAPEAEQKRTAVICPQFQSDTTKPYADCWSKVAYWKDLNWNDGRDSANPPPVGGVSSFDYLDAIIGRAAMKYYNTKKFIVMGHSRGWQAVQRYALLDAGIGIWLWQTRGARIRYLCYNHYHYTFLVPERYFLPPATPEWDCLGPNPAYPQGWEWGIPDVANWDAFPYGLENVTKDSVTFFRGVKAINTMGLWAHPQIFDLGDRAVLQHAYLHKDIYHVQQLNDVDTDCTSVPFPEVPTVGGNIRTAQQGWTRVWRFDAFRESFQFLGQANWAEQRCIGLGLDDLTPWPSPCTGPIPGHSPAHAYSTEVSLDKILGQSSVACRGEAGPALRPRRIIRMDTRPALNASPCGESAANARQLPRAPGR